VPDRIDFTEADMDLRTLGDHLAETGQRQRAAEVYQASQVTSIIHRHIVNRHIHRRGCRRAYPLVGSVRR
jgi:hypothetical protein